MKPQIRIFRSLEELSRDAASLFAEQAAVAIRERDRFLVALNGGGTPKRTFQLLATEFRDKVDWNKTHVFWGDERLVPTSDPENSYAQARELFLLHVPIPEPNVHHVKTELAPDEAANDYSNALNQFAVAPLESIRFDLVYL